MRIYSTQFLMNQFKAILSDLCYAIPTPTEETIALPPVLQFKGECTYTVETDITPSGLQVKYY